MHLSIESWLQIGLYFFTLFLLARPLGSYIARVYEGKPIFLDKIFSPIERLFFRAIGLDKNKEMNWREYSASIIIFTLGGFLLLFAILLNQKYLPLNPQTLPNISPDLAFNIAVSFITNSNWQSYSGENYLSYFTQMAGLTVQNFVSAASGMAVMVALIRGLVRRKTNYLGNFYLDLLRGSLYILLPLSLIYTILLGSEGIVQSFKPSIETRLLQPIIRENPTTKSNETITKQVIAIGPVASQIAIKQLGTNGGGFFNSNSAHPFENPTPFSNFLEMLAILLIPASLYHAFGQMVSDKRQGKALFVAVNIIFIPLLLSCLMIEQKGNPKFLELGINQLASDDSSSGNMEGKEVRFGIVNSVLWASATTASSNGSVNSMHDSYMPLAGLIPMLFMQFGEVIYGGIGSGIYGMIIFILITVFIASLMVGRSPEYLGKKIQSHEIKMAVIAIILPAAACLIGVAIAVSTEMGRATIFNHGAQGFSEILYGFTSAANNNGSSFAGLNANSVFYNISLGICMLIGRFGVIIPILSLAGSLVAKNTTPISSGTLPTHNLFFVAILVAVIVIMGALTFIPALALGPIAEHLNFLS